MQSTMKTYIDQAKQIIADNIYMTIATVSADGRPWVSPVFFAYDDHYNLYWVSHTDAQHSGFVRNNPNVAIVIFDSHAPEGEGDAIYFEATAKEISEESEILSAMTVLGGRVTKDEFRVKEIGQVTGNGLWRIYKAIPSKTTKLTRGESVNGPYIDTRLEINLG